MGYILGFTNEYYTMWWEADYQGNRHDVYPEYDRNGKVIIDPPVFIKNVSMDYDEAIRKMDEAHGKGNYDIDLGQRGYSTRWGYGAELKSKPVYIFAFGKYRGENMLDEAFTDYDYLAWYHNQKPSMVSEYLLMGAGYKYWVFKERYARCNSVSGEYMGVEYFDSCKIISAEKYNELKAKQERRAAQINGHHFENGERVELELIETFSTGWESQWGWTNMIVYMDKENRVFKYMGSAYPAISKEEFTKVKATIKHDSYKNEDETKLQRIGVYTA